MTQPIKRLHVSAYSRAPTDIERDFYSQLIARFKARREDMRMSQEELEQKLGLAEGQIPKWETFQRVPGAFMLMCWSNALGLSLYAFSLEIEQQAAAQGNDIQGGNRCPQRTDAHAGLEAGSLQPQRVQPLAPEFQLRRGLPLALRSLLQSVSPRMAEEASTTHRASGLTGTGSPPPPRPSATCS